MNVWMYECMNVCMYFPESVWAKGSSNSWVCQTFSHLHIFTSHLQVFPFYHPSHLHIFSSSHPHIFTSSHPHIFTSSHLHILTSSHPHIFTSSHLHIFTSSHLLIFTSHLRIFTSSHLHITSSHLHIFTFSLALLLSCPLALLPSSFSFFSISLSRRGAVPTRRHERQPFRTKRSSITKNSCKIAILQPRRQPFGTKWRSIAKDWSKIAILSVPRQPFRTKWGTDVKLRFWSVGRNPLARNEVRWPKTGVKLRFWVCSDNPFARNEVRLPTIDDGWPESEKDVFQAALRMVVVIVGE